MIEIDMARQNEAIKKKCKKTPIAMHEFCWLVVISSISVISKKLNAIYEQFMIKRVKHQVVITFKNCCDMSEYCFIKKVVRVRCESLVLIFADKYDRKVLSNKM